MAIRIKSNWSKTVKRQKTSEDIASALSYISWKLSLDKARNLHGEDFDYSSDHQRIAVIVEFMSFQVHLVDRLLFLDKRKDDYIIGWQEGYQHAPKLEEQRLTDAYEAGYEDGENNNIEKAGNFKK